MARRAPRTARWLRRATVALLVHVLVFAFAASAHAGLVVSNSTVMTAEGSFPDSYDVSLSTTPPDDVRVEFDVAGGQVQPIPPVILTPGTHAQPHPVTVAAVDDAVAELSPHVVEVCHRLVKVSDGSELAPWGNPVQVSILDNDYAGYFVVGTGTGPDTEGDRLTFSISLSSQPTADVVVTFASGDDDSVVAGPPLVFTPANWNVPQDTYLDIVDDDIAEGSHGTLYNHVATSTDPQYDGWMHAPHWLAITDDDQAGIELDPGPSGVVSVTEGTTPATYTLRLTSRPTDDVDIDLASLTGQVTVSPALITFTSANWSSPRIVTVAAVDDTTQEMSPASEQVLHTANSTDPSYSSPPLPDMPVVVNDNDAPGFIVDEPANMTLEEADPAGTERTLMISLATQPTAQVRVSAVSDGQVSMPQSVLTFTTTNWNVPQPLRVQAVDDTGAEGNHTSLLAFSILPTTDPIYSGLGISSRTFQIIDDDSANASIECVDGPDWALDASNRVRLSEDPNAANHTVGCYLQLGTAPLSSVTVNVVASGGQVTVDRPSVTFPAGSSAPELVTFTTTNDFLAEANPHVVGATFQVVSSDPVYGSLGLPTVQFAITDNDTRGVRVVPGGPIEVREGALDVPIGISLTSQPTGPVTITLDAGSELELAGGAGQTMVFTPANWGSTQQVRVKAVDDPFAEQPRHPAPLQLAISSTDFGYATLPTPPIPFDVVDNDVPGVKVMHSGGGTEAPEGGAGDSFGIHLASEPRRNVTLVLTPDAQLSNTPITLNFTTVNWDVAQQVNVQSAQDTVFEGRHEGRMTVQLSSQDPQYDSSSGTAVVAPIVIGIPDDEEGGAVVTESNGATLLTEAGGTDTYSIVLKAQPSSDVVIRPDGAGQAAPNPPAVTFTPANWNVAQTITLAAVQDDADEIDPHVAEVKNVVETQAIGWAGLALSTISARITDDDSAEIDVVQSEGSTKVTEGSKQADKVGFRLKSRPTADVVITPSADPQLTIGAKPIVLTPAAWKDPIELSVLAKDDEEREEEHTGQLTFKVASSDPSYSKATIAAITVVIDDDDGNVTIKPGADGGDGAAEDEDRTPRGETGGSGTGGESTRPGGDGAAGTNDRRTDDGVARTEDGAERTEDGLGAGGIGAGGKKSEDDKPEDEAEELDGEVVAAAERRKPRAKKKPNPVVRAVHRATEWVEDNKEAAATVGGLGLMASGAGTFLLRGDPIKVAQRGLSSLPKGPGSGVEGGDRPNARRVRKGKKKKRGDDSDQDASNS